MSKQMNIRSEAVARATGKGWEAWFTMLDTAGAQHWDHKLQDAAQRKRMRAH